MEKEWRWLSLLNVLQKEAGGEQRRHTVTMRTDLIQHLEQKGTGVPWQPATFLGEGHWRQISGGGRKGDGDSVTPKRTEDTVKWRFKKQQNADVEDKREESGVQNRLTLRQSRS